MAWHAATTRTTELVMTPLRIVLRQNSREHRAVEPGQLISHSDAGSRSTALRFTEHLALQEGRAVGRLGRRLRQRADGERDQPFETECSRTTASHAWAYKAVSDAEWATAGSVDRWNDRRLRGTLGDDTPNEAE